MIAPFILFIFWGGLPLKIFTFILSAFGMYEFYKALKEKDFKPIEMVGYILLILFYLFNNDFEKLIFMIILATFILLIIPVVDLKYNFIDVAITLLGFLYVGILFSFIYLVSEKSGGAFYVWLIFIGSWMTDTTAYLSLIHI